MAGPLRAVPATPQVVATLLHAPRLDRKPPKGSPPPARFIESMECLPVLKLPQGSECSYPVCGQMSHQPSISSSLHPDPTASPQ